MVGVRDPLVDLEGRRLQLEENVVKLQASLRHWQTWEFEYEAMKEEISVFEDSNSQADLEYLSKEEESENTFLAPKEKRLLLFDDRGNVRPNNKVIGLLSRRIDYVQQNIKTISSLLQSAEDRYAALQVLSQPDVRNEEGLPLTEIHEELDEEGHIISSSTSKPGEQTPQVIDALRKAGIEDWQTAEKLEGSDQNVESTASEDLAAKAGNNVKHASNWNENSTETHEIVPEDVKQPPKKSRQSVSFAENTKPEASLDTNSRSAQDNPRMRKLKAAKVDRQWTNSQQAAMNADEINRDQTAPTVRPSTNEALSNDKPFSPVIPKDESAADAALRRQMIQYNMEEVGAVVAELNLEEEESAGSDEDDDYIGETSSAEEDEDQYGRSRRSVLTDDYRAEMEALQRKFKNVGPNPLSSTIESLHNPSERQPLVNGSTLNSISDGSNHPVSKEVRFAPTLDIQEAPNPSPENPPSSPPQPRKLVHTPTVIERFPPSTSYSVPPAEPGDLDPALLKQEVATEYHKMRNRFIGRQGGFMAQGDNGMNEKGEVPLSEAEGGKKRVSRFKAARLGRGGGVGGG